MVSNVSSIPLLPLRASQSTSLGTPSGLPDKTLFTSGGDVFDLASSKIPIRTFETEPPANRFTLPDIGAETQSNDQDIIKLYKDRNKFYRSMEMLNDPRARDLMDNLEVIQGQGSRNDRFGTLGMSALANLTPDTPAVWDSVDNKIPYEERQRYIDAAKMALSYPDYIKEVTNSDDIFDPGEIQTWLDNKKDWKLDDPKYHLSRIIDAVETAVGGPKDGLIRKEELTTYLQQHQDDEGAQTLSRLFDQVDARYRKDGLLGAQDQVDFDYYQSQE